MTEREGEDWSVQGGVASTGANGRTAMATLLKEFSGTGVIVD